jgi:hypothetical protein
LPTCPHCRRSSCKAGLALALLGLVLALCALLMGCARPCRPNLDPRWIRNPITGIPTVGGINDVGVHCEWRY